MLFLGSLVTGSMISPPDYCVKEPENSKRAGPPELPGSGSPAGHSVPEDQRLKLIASTPIAKIIGTTQILFMRIYPVGLCFPHTYMSILLCT